MFREPESQISNSEENHTSETSETNNNQIEIIEMREPREELIENRVVLTDEERQHLAAQRAEREYGQFVTEEDYPEEAERLALHERVKELSNEAGFFIVEPETIVDMIAFEKALPRPIGNEIIQDDHGLYRSYEFICPIDIS
jgi:hypothetical protein